MELKMATQADVSAASSAHYNLEQQIFDEIRRMSLAGKRRLADQIATFCVACEKEAK